MAEADAPGRSNQKKRTRQALLQAAARLLREGRNPSIEDVAEAALVSRATAYRYFPGVEPLLTEAVLDIAMPDAALFDNDPSGDPAERAVLAEAAVHEMALANEGALRRMLVHALQRSLEREPGVDLPARQNRRTPLIEAALAPARDRMDTQTYERLVRALALIVGTEAMIVFKDVVPLPDSEAREVKAWAIRALVEAALRDS